MSVLAKALHLANLMCANGYIFPIDDHILVVKNDGAYYRFQVHHISTVSVLFCYVICRLHVNIHY